MTPTGQLLMEILAARTRLGENIWTFEARHKKQLEKLADMGYVNVMHGIVENSCRASLTEAGKNECMDPGYVPPILRSGGKSRGGW